jgi:hypothetical protein
MGLSSVRRTRVVRGSSTWLFLLQTALVASTAGVRHDQEVSTITFGVPSLRQPLYDNYHDDNSKAVRLGILPLSTPQGISVLPQSF